MIDVVVNNIINEVDVNITTDETNIDFTVTVETTEIDVTVNPSIAANKGDPGEGVPTGGEKNQILFKNSSTDFDTSFKYGWFDYLTGVKYTNNNTSVTGGTVREASFRGDVVYRYTTDSFTGLYPTIDAFYSSFDGTNVTNKIVEKGD